MFGFQDQEDGTKLEITERSVRVLYVSTYSVFVENTLRKHNLSAEFHIRRRLRCSALHRHQSRTF